MTTFQKWLLGIFIAAVVLTIIFWKNVKAFFTTPADIPKSDFQKCKEANAAKPDGEACFNCVAEGSGQPNFNGVIKDGICTVKPEAAPTFQVVQLTVINPNGAKVYALQNNNFVAPINAQTLALNTVLYLNTLVERGGYIKISNADWILRADVQVVMTRRK